MLVKGNLFSDLANDHPSEQYVVIEKYASVASKILPKISHLQNITIIVADATASNHFFAPGEVKQIYLNFSDPWPKRKHHHRRLTAKPFLMQYEQILIPHGRIYFKSDNHLLFEDTVKLLKQDNYCQNHWKIIYLNENQTLSDPTIPKAFQYQTEYEIRFRRQGLAIKTLIAEKCYNKGKNLS